LIGLKGIYVENPNDLGSAWEEALSTDRPAVLEVKTDAEIAPLPPHVSLKEAKGFMFSMVRDDDAAHVLRDTAKQVLNAVLHREDRD
jgi:pyruvate dehydrogenase (quinone)